MIDSIYIEKEANEYPLTQQILTRFQTARHICIERYGEIFNTARQNFRLQKTNQSLILAVKKGKKLLPIPKAYSVGREKNYYFSHLLNCPFDCSYCFLQGMYRSAHFVLFVNYEDYVDEIKGLAEGEEATFFSGYDGDSLALEQITHFTKHFLPFFEAIPRAELELRTKSIQINHLLKRAPQENVIVAYSLNPKAVAARYEPNTPSFEMRMKAIEKLRQHGWNVGLRFDPVLYVEDFQAHYAPFFDEVFAKIPDPHSVTLGGFRVPKELYKQMRKASPNNLVIAQEPCEEKILPFCAEHILKHIPKERFFPCQTIEQYS